MPKKTKKQFVSFHEPVCGVRGKKEIKQKKNLVKDNGT